MSLKGEIQMETETNSGEAKGHHIIKIGKTMEERIREQPKLLRPSAGRSSCCVFRVFQNFIDTNGTKAYQPEIVSIGPYHHRKSHDSHLQMLEEHKWRYLGSLVSRTERHNRVGLADYRKAIQSRESEARDCYSETIELTPEEFVEMMVLDGCFVIELFRKKARVVCIEEDDPIFSMSWLHPCLARDLLKLENQIPFFILQSLFDLSTIPRKETDASFSFAMLAFNFFRGTIPMLEKLVESSNDELAKPISAGGCDERSVGPRLVGRVRLARALETKKAFLEGPKNASSEDEHPKHPSSEDESPKHLLDFMDKCPKHLLDFFHSSEKKGPKHPSSEDKRQKHLLDFMDKCPKHLLDFFRSSFIPDHQEPPEDGNSEIRMIPCATKLHRAGIKCKSNTGPKNNNLGTRMIHRVTKLCQAVIRRKSNTGDSPSKESFLDIKFRKHGVIEMPTISMDDVTTFFLLNCVAYEQCHTVPLKHAYFTTYAAFMDCLINTAEDVGLLCDDQVIENWLGSDKEVAQFFDKSTRDVTINFGHGYLRKVFDDINEYYRTNWNVQWATFRHKYFDSPWSFISLVAAVLLLLLTISQTFFAAYDYYQSRKG